MIAIIDDRRTTKPIIRRRAYSRLSYFSFSQNDSIQMRRVTGSYDLAILSVLHGQRK